MKKLTITIALLLFSIIAYGQTPHHIGKTATQWNDSLYYGGPGDSVYTIDLNFEYEWVKIFLKGNANNSVDSVTVYNGSVLYSNLTGNPSGSADNFGPVFATMVNASTGKETTLTQPPMQLLKLALVNWRGGLTTRAVTFIIQAKKKAK